MKVLSKYKYPIFTFIFFCLSWLFPYSGDDWAWGSSIGADRFYAWFENYNGRYVGNLIVLALTRNNFLKALVMSFVLIGIVYLIDKIIDTNWSFLFGLSMILLMPWQVFSQAVVWTSGFSNYSVSIFLTLIFIYYFLKKDPVSINRKNQIVLTISFVLLGVVCTLIVEHLTIYSLLLGAFSVVFYGITKKKLHLPYLGYFSGCFIGTIYMFSNTAYQSIASEADKYRTVANSISTLIETAVINYATEIYDGVFLSNVTLNILFAVVGVVIYKNIESSLIGRVKTICKLCLSVMVIYSFMSVIHFIITLLEVNIVWLKIFEACMTILAGMSLFTFLIIIAAKKKTPFNFAFLMLSILCMVAPLFVVTPVGGRCFMATYVLFVILLGETVKLIPEKKRDWLLKNKTEKVCQGVVAVIFCAYFVFFGVLYKADRDRLDSIRQQISSGAKEVVVEDLPFDSYIWCGNPTEEEMWEERYKLFYDLPQEIDFVAREKE